MANFKEIINYFEVFSNNHTQNNGYGWGNIADINTNDDMEFPIIYVNPITSTIDNNVTIFKYDIYFLDVLLQDKSNLLDVMNNTKQIGNDFVFYFSDNSESTGFELDEDNVSISPFVGKFDELLGGWIYSIDIETVAELGCNLPLIITPPIPPDNPEVVFGTGTINYLSKWETPSKLTDSLISESGSTLNIHGDLYIMNDIIDSTNTSGETNQVLSVTENGVEWVDIDVGSTDYINNNPVPADFGGVEAGRTFPEGTTIQQVLTDLMYPFQTPAFSSFNIATLGGTHDIGASVTAGGITATWGTTNSTNIKNNSIQISGYNLTTISGLPNDGSEYINITPFVGTSTRSWSIRGENTQNGLFSRNLNMYFRNKRYWGKTTLNNSDFILLSDQDKNTLILNLTGAGVGSGKEFATSRVKAYNGINGAGEYLIFAFPTSFGTPTFIQNGLTNTAFTKYEYTFENVVDYGVPFQIWISDSTYNGVVAKFNIT